MFCFSFFSVPFPIMENWWQLLMKQLWIPQCFKWTFGCLERSRFVSVALVTNISVAFTCMLKCAYVCVCWKILNVYKNRLHWKDTEATRHKKYTKKTSSNFLKLHSKRHWFRVMNNIIKTSNLNLNFSVYFQIACEWCSQFLFWKWIYLE